MSDIKIYIASQVATALIRNSGLHSDISTTEFQKVVNKSLDVAEMLVTEHNRRDYEGDSADSG